MSATFPEPNDEPENEGDEFELDETTSKEFNKGLESFLQSLEEDVGDGPKERDVSVAPTHTLHKETQTWRVELDILHQYVIEVAADSPEEASQAAMSNFPALEPEHTRAHIGSVEPVVPMTITRLEAAWDIIYTSDMNERMKSTKAIELMQDVKHMIERAEVDNLEPADLDRLTYLQTSIIKMLTGD